jgi:GTP-binding protein Era
MRSGFVAVVGRPNVGKSTLINTIIGEKVTITSSRPNTTRHQIRGVLTRPDAQIIFVDTPGIHRPKTRLGERLNESALAAVEGVEVLIPIIEAGESIGPGDRNVLSRSIAAAASTEGPRLLVAVNKIDRAGPNRTAQQLLAAMAEIEKIADAQGERARAAVAKAELFPISAKTGRGVEALLSRVADLLEEGPQYYPSEMLSDQSEPSHIAELVREQLLSRTRDELPHAIFCRVSEWEDNRVTVEILVERDSQKGIVIGKGGEMLKAVGTAARAQLPEGTHLELVVKVEKNWQGRTEMLDRFGL